jgi:ribonucleoside-diphosphate reductase alpha chain
VLRGATHRVPTPVGTAFVTLNADDAGDLREVFVTVGRAGSDLAADAEAIGRLISLVLRVPTNVPHRDLVAAIVDQLAGIGGSTSLGFGAERVRSLADAVAKVLASRRETQPDARVEEANLDGASEALTDDHHPRPVLRRAADLCPQCGEAALVWEEGCRKCYACGFSSC